MTTILFELMSATFDDENKIASGWSDVRLSQLGMDQARQLGTRYPGGSVDAIFFSDLKRAEQTANIAFDLNRRLVFTDWRLRDLDLGQSAGSPRDEIQPTLVNHINEPFAEGESLIHCVQRAASFIKDIKNNWEGRKVLVVGDFVQLYALEYLINGKPLEQSVQDKAEWQPGWTFQLQ